MLNTRRQSRPATARVEPLPVRQGLRDRGAGAHGVRVSSENQLEPAGRGNLRPYGAAGYYAAREVPQLSRDGVICVIGLRLPPSLSKPVWPRPYNDTAQNQRLILNVCFNYGGR